MSIKILQKIDKFYVALGIMLILAAALVIWTFRTVFTVFNTAYEIEQKDHVSEAQVNEENLNKAVDSVFNKESTPLNL